MGPLPVWAWAGIGLVVAYVYAQYRDSKNAAAAAVAAENTYPVAAVSGLGAADGESQIAAPQFIIQNQIPVLPGVPGPQGPAGPAGPQGPTGPPSTTPPTTNPPVVTPPDNGGTTPTKKPDIQYRVKPGDTLSGIAAKYGTTWQALWAYNTTTGVRPAATIATLKKRGPNLLYSNELILVPQK